MPNVLRQPNIAPTPQPSLAEWLRNTFSGGALSPTTEQNRNAATQAEIQQAIAAQRQPQGPAVGQAPRGYSEQEIMNQIYNAAPQYDDQGNRIR